MAPLVAKRFFIAPLAKGTALAVETSRRRVSAAEHLQIIDADANSEAHERHFGLYPAPPKQSFELTMLDESFNFV